MINKINKLAKIEFIKVFANIFENSRWIAEELCELRPFKNFEDLSSKMPVAPIEYTQDLSCPLLGLFGAEDASPTPEQVALHEDELKKHNKDYEFHMYAGAGHGFFYYDKPAFRPEQAADGWQKIWTFFKTHLDN